MNTTQNEKVRCLIIGSGPAGYTAAIYASRANLSPVLYEGIQPGGQLTTTTEVENFPGYPEGVTGTELMEDLRKQAARFGADIRVGIATETDLSAAPYKVTIDGEKVIETETLIISTGATAKYLGLPDEQKYAGMGVSACATCDGFFYRKKVVAVVGGGDTACEEALYLSSLAKQVYLIVRKPYLRASKVMQERVLNTPNITVLFEHNTIGLFGEDGVEGAHLVKRMGELDEEKVDFQSWLSVILRIPRYSNPGSKQTRLAISRQFRVRRRQECRGYSLPEMSLIHIIAKPLRLQVAVVRLQSRRNAICRRLENNCIELMLSL